MVIGLLFLLLWLTPAATAQQGRERFVRLCAPCHGADGAGGERGPSIVDARRIRLRSEPELGELIRKGIPAAGMPGFPLNDPELGELVGFVRGLLAPASQHPAPGDAAAGEAYFAGEGKCLTCHMVNGKGAPLGPDLSDVGARRKLRDIEEALDAPGAQILPGFQAVTAKLADGRAVEGLLKNRSRFDLQIQGLDGEFHFLRQTDVSGLRVRDGSVLPRVAAGAEQRRDLLAFLTRLPNRDALARVEAASDAGKGIPFEQILQPRRGDWPTYDGAVTGNRHSPLRQIGPENVAQLGVKWTYSIPNARLQTTPIAAGGFLYVTHGNDVHALDGRTGRLVWRWNRPKSDGLVGDPVRGFSRGLAVLGNRIFFQTDNGHLVALHRLNGSLLWEIDMVGDAPLRKHYGATSAPLIAGGLVIAGIAGGDGGIRGFLDAYRPGTGERVWRFWTIPQPGEPGSETWQGKALEVGCGSTWHTGTYDAAADLLFWTTGNPCPDYNGDERRGDNLYTSSILALRPRTGKLVWHYQVTPHDVHDFDAQQTPMLIDAVYRGSPRKLLAQASRNGFFYVLDRVTGELLAATPFVEKLTWASGIGPDGRPRRTAGTEPSVNGSRACPAPEGANNWMSNAYHPETGLFYVIALEKCAVYVKSVEWLIPGEQFYGGGARNIPGEPGRKHLRAIELETGKIRWDVAMEGPANTWGGVLSTASGLVFYCDDSGAFAAADAASGKTLWHFHASQPWRASPMTYQPDDRQYVAIAAGASVLAFGLP